MAINYEPIFTYKGLDKISKALQDTSTIQLTHLGLGDAKDNLDYNVSPDDTALKNEIIRIPISTITFTDVIASNNVLMNIEGILAPQDSPNMVIREYGIYDNEGDLLIICRYPDYHTMQTGMPITNMVFRSRINLVNNAAAFTEDYYGSGDYTTVEEFNEHVNNYNNPHNVTHKHIPGLENLDNTSPLNKPFNKDNQDLFTDGKFATGFVDRTSSVITNTFNTISLSKTDNNIPFYIYKYGVRHTIDSNLRLEVTPNSSGYIGCNIDTNSLYFIGEDPNFDTDILVAWYYSNSIDGIIWLNDERHSVTRNIEYHRLTHNETGAIWKYGGELTTSDFTKLNIANFGIADEDLEFDISHSNPATDPFTQVLIDAKLPVLYVVDGKYRRAFNNNTLNWLYDANGALYNNINTGQLLTVSNDNYLTYIVLFTTSIKEPVKLIIGIGDYPTENDAENESFESYGLPMPELVAAYRIILHKNSMYVNAAKTKITKIVRIRNINDGGKADLTNHNLFTDRFSGIQHPTSAITGLDQALAEAGKLKDIELVGTMKSVISVDEITREASLTTFQSDSTNMPAIYGGGAPNGESRVLVDVISSVNRIIFSTLGPDGKIYCPPYALDRAVMFDPATNKLDLIGTTYSNSDWAGAICAPNGNIYCFPMGSDAGILIIDTKAKTTSVLPIAGNPTPGNPSGYYKPCMTKNGVIYVFPNGSAPNPSWLIAYDTNTGTFGFKDLGSLRGINESVVGPNGLIYAYSRSNGYNDGKNIIEFNPANNQITRYGNISNQTDYCGVVLTKEGEILFPSGRLSNKKAMIFNPITKAISYITYTNSESGNAISYRCAVLAGNGKIYCIPDSSSKVLEIDTTFKTAKYLEGEIGSSANGNKFHSATLGANGCVYAMPWTHSGILKIDPVSRTIDYHKYLQIPSNCIF